MPEWDEEDIGAKLEHEAKHGHLGEIQPPEEEDKGSEHPRLDEPCGKHPEFLNRDCPHSHIWRNGAPT